MKTKELVPLVLDALAEKATVKDVKLKYKLSEEQWNRVSKKAYEYNMVLARKKRFEDQAKSNVACTDLSTINQMYDAIGFLASKALCLPTDITPYYYDVMNAYRKRQYFNEKALIRFVEKLVMNPTMRAHQKLGRFNHFSAFKPFSKYIDASLASYYRHNYQSCFLTLAPVIEGVMLRWSGYAGDGPKPQFEELRKFFRHGYKRNPRPGNPLFYRLFSYACDEILCKHFYLNSQQGVSHEGFNRHIASHMISDDNFSTKENCIRLFVLLDTMTELYYYETYCHDYRFYLTHEEVVGDYSLYNELITEGNQPSTIETKLLGNVC
ncbi:hypothetical protein AB6C40_11295 [Vibrio splendidus]